jgi:hypothetical protein
MKNGVLCCFCNESIKSDNVNPCDFNIVTNWDKTPEKQHSQNFWCHAECLQKALHPDIRLHLVVHLFSDDTEESNI